MIFCSGYDPAYSKTTHVLEILEVDGYIAGADFVVRGRAGEVKGKFPFSLSVYSAFVNRRTSEPCEFESATCF